MATPADFPAMHSFIPWELTGKGAEVGSRRVRSKGCAHAECLHVGPSLTVGECIGARRARFLLSPRVLSVILSAGCLWTDSVTQ